jgi:(4S)-4-hydroxy-5-phosphonooxypentane-2,3-dione isomerase
MFDPYKFKSMIKRIVLMQLLPETEGLFLDIFESVKKEIRSQRGCMGLELLRSTNKGETSIWTISLWQSVDDLETYRTSSLFQKTWSEVKPLFSMKAQAWTLTPVETLA